MARALSRAAGALLVLLGALVLLGWWLDIPLLMGPGRQGITMKANAAVAFLLAGGSLVLVEPGRGSPVLALAGQLLALGAGAIGAATLSQHLFGWNLGIDELLFTESPGAAATTSPGRMGPPASLSFLLAGVSLLLLHARRWSAFAHLASTIIGLIALLGVIGYGYGVEPLYGVARITGIALHTAVALGIMGSGMLAASAERGTAAVLVGDGVGSMMARRLLMVALVVPLLLGWLRIQLGAAGYFDTRFGVAVLVLALILVLGIVIMHTAVVLERVERRQLMAEARARERLAEIETMMEVLPIGAFMMMGASSRVSMNREARELLRLGPDEAEISLDRLPSHFRVFHEGREVQGSELPVVRAAREGVTVEDMALDIVFNDGIVRNQLVSALALLDERGQPRGAIASMLDITARRAAEGERERLLALEKAARAEAEQATQAKDDFIATVSHELRTPLQAILGWVSLLRDASPLDEPTRRHALEAIDRSCTAQRRLIEDLLDVSRIAAGNLRLELDTVDLAGVVRAAGDMVRAAAEAKRIDLRMQLDDAARRVRGDTTRLLQVVWNLLSNAINFSPPGSCVQVRLGTEGSDAVLRFMDDGEGIAPEFLPHVFDRFTRGNVGRTARGGGMGLGLAIARNLVEMHGGTLHVTSAGLGRGACFTVRLPLLQGPSAEHVVQVSSPGL